MRRLPTAKLCGRDAAPLKDRKKRLVVPEGRFALAAKRGFVLHELEEDVGPVLAQVDEKGAQIVKLVRRADDEGLALERRVLRAVLNVAVLARAPGFLVTFGVGKAVRAGDDEREDVFAQFRSDFVAPRDARVFQNVVQ